MKRKKFLLLGLLLLMILSGCNATEAETHALSMDTVKQVIRAGIHFGTSAALKSIK